jgi:RNA polymerase sigma factor (TIGR02999 family)
LENALEELLDDVKYLPPNRSRNAFDIHLSGMSDREKTAFGDPADQEALTRIIALLRRRTEQEPTSLAALFTLLQDDIRRLARAARVSVWAGDTLSTTALVNELYFKFHQHLLPEFADRQHFLGVAMRAMRQVLYDYARKRYSQKRGGDLSADQFDTELDFSNDEIETQNMLELHDALALLETTRPRLAQVVSLRYFVGLSDAEIGSLLDVEESTVRRDWLKARVWLYEKMH